ncbi:hypothetical protein ACFQZI_00945 [Mucilaginibacter lutimaris]|uniref:DUF3108 domain-containing protein n=1 Tax=Mucilaginibacter lutimaris TaxID=931629 RepID=A0ABW2ZBI0_9SPHI
MKKNLLLSLLVAASLSAGAQTLEKKARINDDAEAVYHVNRETRSKDGIFAVQNPKTETLWAQGNYKNDERTGNWNFFNKDFQLAMRYNYDQKKVAFINKDELTNVTVKILSNDNEVKNNATAPLPICSMDYYLMTLANSLKSIEDDGKGVNTELVAHVGADGKATYTVSFLINGKKTNEQKLNVLGDKFAIDWVPSMYHNKPIDSEFIVYANITGSQPEFDQTKRLRLDN